VCVQTDAQEKSEGWSKKEENERGKEGDQSNKGSTLLSEGLSVMCLWPYLLPLHIYIHAYIHTYNHTYNIHTYIQKKKMRDRHAKQQHIHSCISPYLPKCMHFVQYCSVPVVTQPHIKPSIRQNKRQCVMIAHPDQPTKSIHENGAVSSKRESNGKKKPTRSERMQKITAITD
jgi:hypothetical protein